MADTVRAILQAAYEENEIYGATETIPDEDLDRGVRSFQDLLNELANGGAFGRVRPVVVTGDTTAQEGVRIGYSGVTSATVTLPTTIASANDPAPYGSETPSDAMTNEDQDVRAPKDHALAEIAGTAQMRQVYDALLGDWVQITGLTDTSDAPLCNRWRGEFIAIMAFRLCRKAMQPAFEREARAARARIVSNPSAPRVETAGSYF
mgnify:CR=1 FL=1